jgi:holo-[acyl-carrier protein] synthase
MIYGIGIDIVDVKRIEGAIGKWGQKFIERVYTVREAEYCLSKAYPFQSFAVRFAAKEAFIKAFKTDRPVAFRDIETVIEGNTGRPTIRLSGKVKDVFDELLKDGAVHLSLSHDNSMGAAFVVIEVHR